MGNEPNYYDKININGDERPLKDNYGRELIDLNSKYTNTTPTPSALGGIAKGTTFSNKPIKDILNDLLYPYVSFSATLSTTPNGGVYEIGTSLTISQAKVNITLGSATISSITIKDSSNNVLATKTSGIVNGNNTISISKTITSNEQIKATIVDSTNATKTANSTQFTFVYPYYYGAINDGVELTETLITGLTKQVVAKGTKTYTITMTQQKGVFAYPSSYGNITKILDANNFNVTDTFVKNTLTINGVSYYVYVLSSPTTATMKYTFSY